MHNYNPKTRTLVLNTTHSNLKSEVNYVEWVSEISMLVETHEPIKILSIIDSPIVNYDTQMLEWLELCVLPVFNNTRLNKLAFVFTDEHSSYQEPTYTKKLNFLFSTFTNKEEAERWLNQSG